MNFEWLSSFSRFLFLVTILSTVHLVCFDYEIDRTWSFGNDFGRIQVILMGQPFLAYFELKMVIGINFQDINFKSDLIG